MKTVRDYILGILNKAQELDRLISTDSSVEYTIHKKIKTFKIQFRYEGIDFYTVIDKQGKLIEDYSSFERDKTSKELTDLIEKYVTNRYDYNSPLVKNSNLDFFTFILNKQDSLKDIYNILTELVDFIKKRE